MKGIRIHILMAVLCLGLLLPAVGLCEEEEIEWDEEEILFDGFFENEAVETQNNAAERTQELESDGSALITITATGDFTIGGDSRKRADIFADELKRQGGDIHFTMRNMRDTLLADDLTIVNFEGTLTDSTFVPQSKKNNQFLFSAPPSYVAMLSENGIEAVALENNHIMDHGEDAYEDTKNALREAGIVYSNSTEIGVYHCKGVDIAMLTYLCIDRYDSLWDKVPEDIRKAKETYPIVIVSFHWGNEKDYAPTQNQIRMGRLAVDSGADLVLGHHSHRMNPIEEYNGVYICYSLGNFCFSGNSKPSDMLSFVFQTRFRVRGEQVTNEGFRIIPIRISSRTDRNDFIPTILTKDTAIDSVITTLKANGRKLEYAVSEYPLTW
ncbi:MAG: CapA family protein [Clostridia bacterium]|nr:CapA family protein [Clostridia bacterium]